MSAPKRPMTAPRRPSPARNTASRAEAKDATPIVVEFAHPARRGGKLEALRIAVAEFEEEEGVTVRMEAVQRVVGAVERTRLAAQELLLDQLLHGLRSARERVDEQTGRVRQAANSMVGGGAEDVGSDVACPAPDGRLHEALYLVGEVNEAITLLAHQVNRLEIL